ncbi:hypothetical protein [Saccharothrix lopnurensis]|uniref:Uncharacterized protein n=1 Tax=Saccharothrix lopnurensis TaxID=1670621 RepID=A0ABW1P0B4_9PSEU
MRRAIAPAAGTGATAAGLITAAATTNTMWLYWLAAAVSALPWVGTLAWRGLFAAKSTAVRQDLLDLVKIEEER